MVKKGPAKKLSIFVDESDRYGKKPVYEVLIDIFYRKKISGVSVFRGVAGYGSDGVYHTQKMLTLSGKMPVKIEVVDSEEMINSVLPDVYQVVEKGLIEVSDTNVIKCCSGREEEDEKEGERMKLEGKAKMLRVIVREDHKWEGEPLYEAIVKRFILMDVAGATVYKAVAGYGPHRRFRKMKFLTRKGELPVLITVIDTEEKIKEIMPVLDEMVDEGIVVLSDVNVIKYTHVSPDGGAELV
jgi:PII-like signaling protein